MSITTWVLLLAVAAVAVGSVVMAQVGPDRPTVPQQEEKLVLLRPVGPNQGYAVGYVVVWLPGLCTPTDTVRPSLTPDRRLSGK